VPEVRIGEGLSWPENPRWHGGCLWFTDMFAKRVCRADPDGNVTDVAVAPGNAGGLGWLPGGDLLMVSMEERRILRLAPGAAEPVVHADLSGVAGGPVNDMVVLGDGSLYAGNFGAPDPAAEPGAADAHLPTRLIHVDARGVARPVGGALRFPNGIAVDAARTRLVVAESFTGRVMEIDIAADGSLGDPRVLADLGAGANPDGLCMDAEGGVWVACLFADLVRIGPDGAIVERIATRATACALGGEDGRTLFALGATYGTFQDVYALRSRGFVETHRVAIPGFLP